MLSIREFLEVLFKLAVPVAGLSFLMVWWGLKKGVLKGKGNVRALKAEIKAISKLKADEKPDMNPLHSKWVKFGGGFYGIVAMYTYGLIEWGEVRDTISGLGGIRGFIDDLSISLFINMFIEGLLNFVAAISWPVFWMSEFRGSQMWIWICIAYGAYWLGARAAQHYSVPEATDVDKSADSETGSEGED